MNIEIANRLINLRKQSGLSQEELAAKLGLSRQAVSKWERAEASPDTDNLICLAKLYGVSLDDLLNTDQPVEEIVRDVKENEKEKQTEEAKTEARINELMGEKGICLDWLPFDEYGFHSVKPTGKRLRFYNGKGEEIPVEEINEIKTANANGTAVSIERDEISIAKAGKGAVHIEEDEVSIVDPSGQKTHYEIDDDGHVHYSWRQKKEKSVLETILVSSSVFVAVIAYLLLGFFLPDNMGWRCWWVVFLLIPISAQLGAMIRTKRLNAFPVVFFCVAVYMPLGFYLNLWHPAWVIFLAIPLFHVIASPIDEARRKKEGAQLQAEPKVGEPDIDE